MDDVIVISVVRDFAMYEKCIGKNPMVQDCRLVPIDNRECNDGVPACYNRALRKFSKGRSAWFVFCHEDFQPKENLATALLRANREVIYGPIGGRLESRCHWMLGGMWAGVFAGIIETCDKDGSNVGVFGEDVPAGTPVDTVDCQCLIVHSSIVERCHLRFDERLSFDLYAEDFCLGAKADHDIRTAILPLKCRHYSRGVVLPRFLEQKSYLDAKYPKDEAFGCVGYTIGGGRTLTRRVQKRIRRFLDASMPWAVPLVFKLLRF